MPLHFPGQRQLSASIGLLQLIALMAMGASIAALAMPGPASETTGMAAVLALAALALLAGHTWAAVVVAAADLILVGTLWPAVFLSSSSDVPFAAAIALGLSLPGLLLFAMTVPNTVEAIIGPASHRVRRMAELALVVSSGAYLVVPVTHVL